MIECTKLFPLVTVLYCISVPLHISSALCFCLIEIEAMVVAVQQALEEFTAILTVCIVSHRPPTCAVTIHRSTSEPAQINSGIGTTTVPASKINGQCAGNTPKP